MAYFTPKSLKFLRDLRKNNTHEWFRDHKADYETLIREPALQLISDIHAPLQAISPHFRAEPRKVGGSLFRVMRDTRRPHPEGPYKPWIGLRFHHEQKREVHAPSFFVHIDARPGEGFMGGGLWRPEPPTLKRIRQFLEENPRAWQAATQSPSLKGYEDFGEWMTGQPRGYAKDHPLLQDLRRRSFIWDKGLTPEEALADDLKERLVRTFQDVAPVVDYLCAALDLPF